jgi:FKBP-type peptidyl-prolyl cis-trans isomerase FklB
MKLKMIAAVALSVFCTYAFADDAAQTQNAGTTATATADASTATMDSSAVKNKQTGDAFLKANKTKPGVVALPDGLQYKVIKAGKGAKPSDTDVVTVQYEGRLIDGTVFDSSDKHGGSIDFPVGQVIPGWVEALKLMQPGATWELFIPSDLAYGEAGAPPAIGPNETLIFKVSLVNFKKSS